ncbi:MAG: DUF4271 domain-containing protein [Alistipes sp.]|nr:DUF4271 domain-containing protein [Alistipes sp.]
MTTLLPDLPADTAAAIPGDSLSRLEAALRRSLTPVTAQEEETPAERSATAAELFGERSTLASLPPAPALPAPGIASNAPFQGIVLGLAFLYLALLGRRLREVRSLMRRLSFDRSRSRRMSDLQGNAYIRFVRTALGFGLLLAPLLLLRLIDLRMPIGTLLPAEWLPLLVAAGVGGTALLLLFQVGSLRLWGNIALARYITDPLTALKLNYAALAFVLLTPCALLFLLAPPETAGILAWLLAAVGGGLLLLYLRESFILFMSKNISILHWILYLCAVEIFPVSYLWLRLTKI